MSETTAGLILFGLVLALLMGMAIYKWKWGSRGGGG